jgi:RNA polymerase sigma-70 factor (ECF subfamily)
VEETPENDMKQAAHLNQEMDSVSSQDPTEESKNLFDRSTGKSTIQNDDLMELIQENQSALLRYAGRLLSNYTIAQDLVQEAFIRCIKNPPQYGSARQKTAWMYRVTHNICIDYLKRENRRGEIYDQTEKPQGAEHPVDTVRNTEYWNQMEHMLGELSDNQRSVIILFFQENKSYKDIATATGLSLSNVGMLLHRGLKKLKSLVNEDEFREYLS